VILPLKMLAFDFAQASRKNKESDTFLVLERSRRQILFVPRGTFFIKNILPIQKYIVLL